MSGGSLVFASFQWETDKMSEEPSAANFWGHKASDGVWEHRISEAGTKFWEIKVGGTLVVLDSRPRYCNRGNWLAKIFMLGKTAKGDHVHTDEQDRWPRYFFHLERAKAEVEDWLRVRQILSPTTGRKFGLGEPMKCTVHEKECSGVVQCGTCGDGTYHLIGSGHCSGCELWGTGGSDIKLGNDKMIYINEKFLNRCWICRGPADTCSDCASKAVAKAKSEGIVPPAGGP